MPQVTLREDPPRRLAALMHRGAYPTIGATFDRLYAELGAQGLLPQAGLPVGIYYDDPSKVAPEDQRAHAGAELTSGGAAPLEIVTLAGGRHAVLTVSGPYDGLPDAWNWLYNSWLPGSGETPAPLPPFEVYLNAPMNAAPEDLRTEICLPLA